MPWYDFICFNHPGGEYPRVRVFSDAEKCPECGENMSRIYYLAPVHWRGGGFYATDSAKR